MIDGLRLDVSADEIVKLIDQRIAEHEENADADEETAAKLGSLRQPNDPDDDCWAEDSAPQRLRRRAQRERERIDALRFMRDHVVRGETYRLTNEDLRTLEILDTRPW
jgi:hypothetical protein